MHLSGLIHIGLKRHRLNNVKEVSAKPLGCPLIAGFVQQNVKAISAEPSEVECPLSVRRLIASFVQQNGLVLVSAPASS